MRQNAEIREIKERHKKAILEKPNVVGVGVGYKVAQGRETDELSLVALVRQKLPKSGLAPDAMIPQEVNGVPVDVRQVGNLRVQERPPEKLLKKPLQERTDRWRPAPGGVSIGHYQTTAGTLGCVVRDLHSGERLILSNNHILANCNSASPGDPILQPGAYDGKSADEDIIARLERFVPVRFQREPVTSNLVKWLADSANWLARLVGSRHRLEVRKINPQAANQVDAALARPLDYGEVLDEILEIGLVIETATAVLGMPVRKSGRTTGLTTGQITVIDATVNVSYGVERTATFEDQILTGPMSQGGDSGSLVVAGDTMKAVGLLFAGSNQSTVFSPIQLVLDKLGVSLARTPGLTMEDSGPAIRPAIVPFTYGDLQAASERAQAVKQAYGQELLAKPNVVGLGVGITEKSGQPTGQVGLVVMVEKKVPKSELDPQDIIPAQIEGVPLDVREVGKLQAQ